MTQQLNQGLAGVRHVSKFVIGLVASLAGVAVLVGLLALFVGARDGWIFIHEGEAHNAGLFAGPAVVTSEQDATKLMSTCGVATHTLASVAASTLPYQVHSVVLTGQARRNFARQAAAFTGCLDLHLFSNVGAEGCVLTATSTVGLTPDSLGSAPYPWAEVAGRCMAGEGV